MGEARCGDRRQGGETARDDRARAKVPAIDLRDEPLGVATGRQIALTAYLLLTHNNFS